MFIRLIKTGNSSGSSLLYAPISNKHNEITFALGIDHTAYATIRALDRPRGWVWFPQAQVDLGAWTLAFNLLFGGVHGA